MSHLFLIFYLKIQVKNKNFTKPPIYYQSRPAPPVQTEQPGDQRQEMHLSKNTETFQSHDSRLETHLIFHNFQIEMQGKLTLRNVSPLRPDLSSCSRSQELARPSAPPIYFNRETKTNDSGLIGSRSLGTRAGAPPLSPAPAWSTSATTRLLGQGCRNRGATQPQVQRPAEH